MPTSTTPEASVVVPSYRGRRRLPVLFKALEAQSITDYEVIVVLDGDEDGSAAIADDWAGRIPLRTIVFPENRGRSAALNAGFAAARGRVLIRCDDDLEPPPTFVERHIAHHRAAHPVGVIGLCPDVYFETTYAKAYGRAADKRVRTTAAQLAPDERWRQWSANVSVTRETFERVGPYDEGFRQYGWEDVDWGYRVHLAGIPIVVATDVDAFHHNPAPNTTERAARAYLSGSSRRHFVAKHGPVVSVAPVEHNPWNLLVRTLTLRMRDQAAVRGVGTRVDSVIRHLPRPVAEKAVAAVVEAAAVAARRPGATADPIDDTNRTLYARSDIAGRYAGRDTLQDPERAIVEEYAGALRGARILDLGVGAGRTTGHLEPLAATYVGVDYSPEFIAAARIRFPHTDLRIGDARDLSAFATGSVDVVMFSFNGIDYVDHADRLVILGEIRRVLAPGGLFVFSTHNRDWVRFDKMPWQQPERLGRQWLRASVQGLRALPRHRQLQRQGERTPAYAIINDDAHDYSLLTYYITARSQFDQLIDAGFRPEAIYGLDGTKLASSEARETAPSCWLYYVANVPS